MTSRPKPPCRGYDPETWFPISAKDYDTIALAKSICELCDIRIECLQYALEEGIPFGIWGGQTEHDRRALLRRHAIPTERRRELGDHRDRTALVAALADQT